MRSNAIRDPLADVFDFKPAWSDLTWKLRRTGSKAFRELQKKRARAALHKAKKIPGEGLEFDLSDNASLDAAMEMMELDLEGIARHLVVEVSGLEFTPDDESPTALVDWSAGDAWESVVALFEIYDGTAQAIMDECDRLQEEYEEYMGIGAKNSPASSPTSKAEGDSIPSSADA